MDNKYSIVLVNSGKFVVANLYLGQDEIDWGTGLTADEAVKILRLKRATKRKLPKLAYNDEDLYSHENWPVPECDPLDSVEIFTTKM